MSDLRRQLIRSLAADGSHLRLVRTLPEVLSEIGRIGPMVWAQGDAARERWAGMPHDKRSEALDKLDDLQAEARGMIEAATGVSWDAIQDAVL